jgi:thiosulfate dehydrogenase (quinone) large subunit
VTSKPAPAPTAPEALGRVLLPLRAFAFAWTPLLLAGSGSVLSLDAAVKDWAGRQAAAARRQARRSGATVPEVHRREVVLGGMTTAAVAAVSLVIGGLAAGLGRLAGATAGTGGPSSLPSAIGPGAVEVGPAATGLKRLAIAEGSDGQLYVT